METMVRSEYIPLVKELKEWVVKFCSIKPDRMKRHLQTVQQYKPEDAFVGYHEDIISSIVLGQTAKVEILTSPVYS